jgi:hypothetical protein
MAVGFPTKVDYATGDVLSATNMNDLSGTVNLLESAQYAAGKNVLLNGDCVINQRNATSVTTTTGYVVDRFSSNFTGGTVTASQETLTPGNTISGYEFSKFIKVITAGQSAVGDFARLRQAFETIYWGAGQTVSLSFWAKADSGTPQIGASWTQNFGGGGSASVNTKFGTVTLSTSWTRYTITGTMPSITGKTIGTNPFNTLQFWFSAGASVDTISLGIGIQNNTFSVTGFQLEIASTASPFQTATGTIQGELAACQRYYWRTTPGINGGLLASGSAITTTDARFAIKTPVTMRIIPTSVDFLSTASINIADGVNAEIAITGLALTTSVSSQDLMQIYCTSAGGLTAFRPYYLKANTAPTAYIGLNAEL